ncbi:MAG: AroM family protein [Candidatus Hadarchaeum sp.]|uniref:AroM family protein n=1 Tax=Candidatus Hadarchaeum sp. TaxID=2883567 RepID=UPI00316D1D3D
MMNNFSNNSQKKIKVALLSFGQTFANNNDINEIKRRLPSNVELITSGILDGLSREEVESKYAAHSPSRCYFTKMADGEGITVDISFVHRKYKECLQLLEGKVEVIGIMCSSKLPLFTSRTPIIIPYELVKGFLATVRASKPWGIVMPTETSVFRLQKSFRHLNVDVVYGVLSPGTPSQAAVDNCIQKLHQQNVFAVVLNCFGYSQDIADELQKRLDAPVFRVASLFINVLVEYVHTLLNV